MSDFTELAKERFSVRDYSDRPIEEEKLAAILEAGRLAPTAKNNQPQKIYLIKSKEALEKIRAITRCAFNAPVVAVLAYDSDREWNSDITPGMHSGWTDSAIVCTHMMLEAQALGIGSCWVCWFDVQAVRDMLGLPDNIVITNLLPLGYPSDTAAPSPRHTQYRDLEDMLEII